MSHPNQQSEVDAHDCMEHLRHRAHVWVETHGLDCPPYEHCYQEWWCCKICGEKFDEADLKRMGREGF
jgi:hypothetical protein